MDYFNFINSLYHFKSESTANMNDHKKYPRFLNELPKDVTINTLIPIYLSSIGPPNGKVNLFAEGKFGLVYSIVYPQYVFPGARVAKLPHLRNFNNLQALKETFEKLFYELEITSKLRTNPWINTFTEVEFFLNWPFLISRLWDGTLSDLISDPSVWDHSDKLQVCILIVRGLMLSREQGILTHQDLKPENIFIRNAEKTAIAHILQLQGKSNPIGSQASGIKYWVKIGDLAMANAFTEFFKNAGSRPYQAPEQYRNDVIDPSNASSVDVFALGVIFHEMFSNGLHPLGIRTKDYWPRAINGEKKWTREEVWKKWARRKEKILHVTNYQCSEHLQALLKQMMAAKTETRPNYEHILKVLIQELSEVDANRASSVKQESDYWENEFLQNEDWPHQDNILKKARLFYRDLK